MEYSWEIFDSINAASSLNKLTSIATTPTSPWLREIRTCDAAIFYL